MILEPSYASAGFFSDLVAKVFGTEVQASEITNQNDDMAHNSQNIPLLESSINPDVKNIEDVPTVAIVEDEALLSNNNPFGIDDELEKYASSAKINTYVVKQGDTIEGIAKKLGVPKSTIIDSNADLKKSDLLKIGQTLVVLPVKEHVVDSIDIVASASNQVAAKKEEVKKVEEPEPIAKKTDTSADMGPMFTINTDMSPSSGQVQVQTPVLPVIQLQVNSIEQIQQSSTPSDEKPEESGQPTGIIAGGYIWPLPAGVGRVSQGLHADQAYDFAAPKDTPIYAIQNGTVFIAHPSGYNGGYGKYVVINFDDGRQAIFGHMNTVVAKAGDVVKQGDIIGYVGSTGKSTGPHVHVGWHGSLGSPFLGLKVNSKSLDSND